jgi:SOS-response transcriptional repressor LexA
MKRALPVGDGKHDRKVIAFLNSYWKHQFQPPTLREIMTACDISSTSVIAYTLRRLERDGKIITARGAVPVWVRDAIAKHTGVSNG